MKRYLATFIGILTLAVAITVVLALGVLSSAQATNTPGSVTTDHALFDTTGGEAGVGCKADNSFDVHISVQDANADGATFKVLFVNDSTGTADQLVNYNVPAGHSVNISQAAGGTPNADTHIVVSVQGSASGWMSLSTDASAKGFDGAKEDYCRTYTSEADAIADK
ncbi:MAG TPA: hypothetical protein VFR32_10435 [Gaiellaceae bacterium]|nr:hypothetical protein [Gaiellaceae bacterium]